MSSETSRPESGHTMEALSPSWKGIFTVGAGAAFGTSCWGSWHRRSYISPSATRELLMAKRC